MNIGELEYGLLGQHGQERQREKDGCLFHGRAPKLSRFVNGLSSFGIRS